jgi:tRNA dimethylallyltransferase
MEVPLMVLAGPTGAGKTALGVRLAEWLHGEIISADSRQIYRDFNLGTGKPSPQECARVRHHLVSAVSPRSRVTAAEYACLAGNVLKDLEKRRLPVLVIGGTGLWIRALVDGLAPTPPSDPGLRAQIEQRGREQGPQALYSQLQSLDAARAACLSPGDSFRIIRALEIIELTGKTASAVLHQQAENVRFAWWLGISRPRAELYARAEKRIDGWLAEGWLEEVRQLLQQGLEPGCPAFQALGYLHLVQHLQGFTALDQTVELIKRDTRRYIKRQLTWFMADPRITWFDASDEEKAFVSLQAYLTDKLNSSHSSAKQ